MTFTKEKETVVRTRLIRFCREMAEHTLEDCENICLSKKYGKGIGSCCDSSYCGLAIKYALDFWNTMLQPVDGWEPSLDGALPLLGPGGCTAAPHLRPLCTVHHCDISGKGFKPGDEAWTDKYFRLREKIDRLMTVLEMIDGKPMV